MSESDSYHTSDSALALGEDYGDGIDGWSRRRIGLSAKGYTVFTVNWIGLLEAGNTYVNRVSEDLELSLQ